MAVVTLSKLIAGKAMEGKDVNYLVAVMTSRLQAEEAYFALRKAELPIDQLDILGRGFKSADDFGLINPNDEASKQVNGLSNWTILFGFAAGYCFNLLTGIEILSWAGEIGNHILGGIFGAAAGAFGAYVSGTLTGFTVGSGDAIAYRNRLNAGKYLIIASGTGAFIRQATQLIREFEPENLQGYVETVSA